MGDPAIKKRLARAKEAAIDNLLKNGHKIIPSDNSIFCILGVRKKEIRMIRVVVDKIKDEDIKIVQAFEPPGICTKEIWCRKGGQKDFEITEI